MIAYISMLGHLTRRIPETFTPKIKSYTIAGNSAPDTPSPREGYTPRIKVTIIAESGTPDTPYPREGYTPGIKVTIIAESGAPDTPYPREGWRKEKKSVGQCLGQPGFAGSSPLILEFSADPATLCS